jgi:hypothetical protein
MFRNYHRSTCPGLVCHCYVTLRQARSRGTTPQEMYMMFSTMPTDTLLRLLSFLGNISDLQNLSLTSRLLFNIISASPSLWRDIAVNQYSEFIADSSLHYYFRRDDLIDLVFTRSFDKSQYFFVSDSSNICSGDDSSADENSSTVDHRKVLNDSRINKNENKNFVTLCDAQEVVSHDLLIAARDAWENPQIARVCVCEPVSCDFRLKNENEQTHIAFSFVAHYKT